MKFKYKTLMFFTLFVFCIGSVCATDPSDNIDSDSKVKQIPLEKFKLGKQVTEKMRDRIKDLNRVVTDQGAEIKKLKEDNKRSNENINTLLYDNAELKKNVTTLTSENEKLNDRIERLEESNKKQDVEIQDLKAKLNDRDSEIKRLNDEIRELHNQKDKLYETLLSSPKVEDLNQLKKQIADKNNQIKQLTAKIETLYNIFSVSENDVSNSLKGLSYVEKIQCGKYVFEHDDYLKIPLIKDGKKRIMEYKNKHGKLPNYVTIAGYKLSQEKYKKLYNM